MNKPVLIVIDMLGDCFVQGQLVEQRATLCSSINMLTETARNIGVPVIWVRQEFNEDLSDAFLEMRKERIRMFVKGTPGSAILPELCREKSDLEIIKKRYSMFYDTELTELLVSLKPSSLVLAGVNTHACVRMAAIDAYQRDYEVTIVSDCVSSNDQEHHDITMRYLSDRIARIATLEEVKQNFYRSGSES